MMKWVAIDSPCFSRHVIVLKKNGKFDLINTR